MKCGPYNMVAILRVRPHAWHILMELPVDRWIRNGWIEIDRFCHAGCITWQRRWNQRLGDNMAIVREYHHRYSLVLRFCKLLRVADRPFMFDCFYDAADCVGLSVVHRRGFILQVLCHRRWRMARITGRRFLTMLGFLAAWCFAIGYVQYTNISATLKSTMIQRKHVCF